MPIIVAKSSCKLFTLSKMYDDYYTTHTIPKPIFEYPKLLNSFLYPYSSNDIINY